MELARSDPKSLTPAASFAIPTGTFQDFSAIQAVRI